jgi:hypothetical protein
MSYSTDPVLDAARHYEALDQAQEAQVAAEFAATGDFLAACHKGDANALADFAPTVRDLTGGIESVGANTRQRMQRLHEVMAESLDYGNGPTMSEAMQLLINAAHSDDLASVQMQARALLRRMGSTWAEQNVIVGAV